VTEPGDDFFVVGSLFFPTRRSSRHWVVGEGVNDACESQGRRITLSKPALTHSGDDTAGETSGLGAAGVVLSGAGAAAGAGAAVGAEAGTAFESALGSP
jgi:hypothetical protein